MQAGDAKYTICTISQDESNCASLHVPSNENVAMFFFSEKGMHHLMLSDFFFRLTDNGWQLCFPRLG